MILPPVKLIMLTPEVFAKYADENHVVKNIPLSQQKQLFEDCRMAFAIPRWRRFIMRLVDRYMWHARSLLLWLVQRSSLRFLPFPYPSISTVEDWEYQARTMAEQLVVVPRHTYLATKNKAFTSKNLLEMSRFRDRVGWRFAFMGDSVLSGLMALKASCGVNAKLKAAALEEARQQVATHTDQKERAQAARELIGPRGGLPSLKADLVKLALLCDVTVLESDTIPILQQKIRPVVAVLRDVSKGKDVAKAYITAPAAKPKAVVPPPVVAASVEEPSGSMRSSSPELMTAQQMATIMDNRLHGAILEQDQRLQAMMAQVMRHIEERFKNLPALQPIPNGLPSGDASMADPEEIPTMPR